MSISGTATALIFNAGDSPESGAQYSISIHDAEHSVGTTLFPVSKIDSPNTRVSTGLLAMRSDFASWSTGSELYNIELYDDLENNPNKARLVDVFIQEINTTENP